MADKTKIRVEVIIKSDIQTAWNVFTTPETIKKWNFADSTWCCLSAENDLRPNGKFSYRMEAKDGSVGFDFSGIYVEVKDKNFIKYKLGEYREVTISFLVEGTKIRVIEEFDAETTNPIELQKNGWQAILNNYKKCVEGRGL